MAAALQMHFNMVNIYSGGTIIAHCVKPSAVPAGWSGSRGSNVPVHIRLPAKQQCVVTGSVGAGAARSRPISLCSVCSLWLWQQIRIRLHKTCQAARPTADTEQHCGRPVLQ